MINKNIMFFDKKRGLQSIFAIVLLYELCEKSDNQYPICGASFNVILEGLFRDRIKDDYKLNGFTTQTIKYKNKEFYITKIQLNNNSHFSFLPIKKNDDIINIPNEIHIKNNHDDFYVFYKIIASDKDKISKKSIKLREKDKIEIETIATFYSKITNSSFFVQENQYLKAMLFKMLFHSINEDDIECESNKIINIAHSLLIENFENNSSNELEEKPIKKTNNNIIDAYLIHNAFIRAYKQLNDNQKTTIKSIHDRYNKSKLSE